MIPDKLPLTVAEVISTIPVPIDGFFSRSWRGAVEVRKMNLTPKQLAIVDGFFQSLTELRRNLPAHTKSTVHAALFDIASGRKQANSQATRFEDEI